MRDLKLALSIVLLAGPVPCAVAAPLTRSPLPPVRAAGWTTDLRTGSAGLGIPAGQVPGDIPIPVGFGVTTGFRVDRYNMPHYIRYPDGTSEITGYTTLNAIRPVYGTMHFGFIRNAWQYGAYVTEPISTILEDGKEVDGTAPYSGPALLLPKAYGFAVPASPMVDDKSTHLFYDTTSSGLSTPAASLVAAHLPTGFGTISTTYKVVMDKDLARVFAQAQLLGAGSRYSGWTASGTR